MLSTLSCLWHSMVSSVGKHGDGPESELTLKALQYVTFLVLLSLSHKVFRCETNCIDSWHLRSSILFIITRVPTHKKYRILCYPLRSISGWLPIRCAYFILTYMCSWHPVNYQLLCLTCKRSSSAILDLSRLLCRLLLYF